MQSTVLLILAKGWLGKDFKTTRQRRAPNPLTSRRPKPPQRRLQRHQR
jgi:hypothetical protein